jgi:hypothetical protein
MRQVSSYEARSYALMHRGDKEARGLVLIVEGLLDALLPRDSEATFPTALLDFFPVHAVVLSRVIHNAEPSGVKHIDPLR